MEGGRISAIGFRFAILVIDLDTSIYIVTVLVDEGCLRIVHSECRIGVEGDVHDLCLHLGRVCELIVQVLDINAEDDCSRSRFSGFHPDGIGTISRHVGIILSISAFPRQAGPAAGIPTGSSILKTGDVALGNSRFIIAVKATELEGHSHRLVKLQRRQVDDRPTRLGLSVLVVDLQAEGALVIDDEELAVVGRFQLRVRSYRAHGDAIVTQGVAVLHDSLRIERQGVGIVGIDLTLCACPIESLAVVDDLLPVAITRVRQEDGVAIGSREADSLHPIDGLDLL